MKIGTIVYLLEPDHPDIHQIKKMAKMLKEGKTVVFPTETVYGLGAHALDDKAVEKIYQAKGRPSDNPLIVHVHKSGEVEKIARNIGPNAKILMDSFWPGPLTLILQKQDHVPDKVTGGLSTVGVRIPDNNIALEILREADIPIAAPSANISGKTSPTSPSHVIEDMLGRVDCIAAGGECTIGLESTVVDMTKDNPVILRPGAITMEDITSVLGQVLVTTEGLKDENQAPKAPGMKYAHYCPDAPMMLFKGEYEKMVQTIMQYSEQNLQEGKKVAIMATDQSYLRYKTLQNVEVLSMGSRQDPKTVARSIFKNLRTFDSLGVDIIFCEWIEEKGLGVAIMNRLKKAASGNILEIE
jgi:L-threonylcarbamoyladenylate synthase